MPAVETKSIFQFLFRNSYEAIRKWKPLKDKFGLLMLAKVKTNNAFANIITVILHAAFIGGLFGLIPVWRENQSPTNQPPIERSGIEVEVINRASLLISYTLSA